MTPEPDLMWLDLPGIMVSTPLPLLQMEPRANCLNLSPEGRGGRRAQPTGRGSSADALLLAP
jgi:hypothetical protein